MNQETKKRVVGVKKQLRKLKEEDVLRRIGPDRGGHWEICKGKG